MLELYTWTTPNGQKPVIMLEELGAPYQLHLVNIGAGAQKQPEFLAVNPNGKIPALVDRTGGSPVRVFESGAILIHLAEKYGRLLPPSGPERAEVLSWLFLQVGGTGPMLGQYYHFTRAAKEKIPYAIERYRDESLRLLGVLNARLRDHDYLAGDYSIADIIHFNWAVTGLSVLKEEGAREFTALQAWVERVGSREQVKHALHKLDTAKAALA